MKRILSAENIKQFLSYFGVGGAAAIVEWVTFFVMDRIGLPYLISTIIAFIVATFANWYLGRVFTFKNSAYKDQKTKEIFLVFLVSAIGLGFNLLLMYLFVDVIGMNTNLLKVVAKIAATGIVFVWNFLSRKLWIYRTEENTKSEDK